MKSSKQIYEQELKRDMAIEKKLIVKEIFVIFILILLTIIREVFLHE